VIDKPGCAPLAWSTATERVRLLGCNSTSSTPTVFGPLPGIEQVHFANAGRGDRDPIFRRVAADQSVAVAVAR
jgi:hypothetical protein